MPLCLEIVNKLFSKLQGAVQNILRAEVKGKFNSRKIELYKSYSWTIKIDPIHISTLIRFISLLLQFEAQTCDVRLASQLDYFFFFYQKCLDR